METRTSRWLALITGVMVLSTVSAATETWSVVWPRQVNVSLTVVDAEGKAVPQFEAMLHTHQEGYIRWQPGRDGVIRFGPRGADYLTLQNDPQIQVIVRAPDLAPAILHLEYTRPAKETVILTPGRLIDLFVQTVDGRSIPEEVKPLVIYRDFVSRVRIYRMPENQSPDYVPDFEMSKVQRIAEGHYQFRVPIKSPPFLLAIDAPGFLRSVESGYFDEDDLVDGRIEWEIPAPATLHLQFDAVQTGGLPPYESSEIGVAWQIPEEGKYITLWLLRQFKESAVDVALDDLPPGRYRAILALASPQSQKTDMRWYSDNVPFRLAAGEEKTLKLAYSPSDPNGWRGHNTIDAVVRECGGRPAAGKRFTLNYVVPHGGWLRVLEGALDDEGGFRLANVAAGPNGPEFALRIGEEWLAKMRVTEPGNKHFEFTLAPEVNDIAPEVTFLDIDENKEVSLRSLRGRIVYLEFWATWCGPCRLPMIRLNEVMKRHSAHWAGRVEVLAASIDDSPEIVKWRTAYEGWTHLRHVWAGAEGLTDFDSPVGQAFGVNGIPMAFLIAPNGRIVWKGHPNRDTDFEAQIDELCKALDKTK